VTRGRLLIRRWDRRRLLVIAVVLAAISTVCAARILATVVAPGNWGLDRIDQRAGTDNTFTFGATGRGVNLYVIDTGVLGAHVDFQDRRAPRHRSRVTYIGHFCAANGIPRPDSPEMYAGNDGYDGHGTHNASFAAGNTYGVAKDARILSLRAQSHDINEGPNCGETRNDGAAVAAAVKWITAHGQRPGVVNISFAFDRATDDLQNAIHASVQAGFVYVLSGKTGGTGHWGNVLPNETMIVGGTRANDTPIGEGYGSDLALFAPAEGLYGAGRMSVTDVSIPEASGFCPTLCAGDSFAAPFVSGVAATYLELRPQASPAAVRSALLSAATSVSTLSKPLLYSRLTLAPKPPA
jgi:subtilisin family serine protease